MEGGTTHNVAASLAITTGLTSGINDRLDYSISYMLENDNKSEEEYPPGFDPRLKGAVNPAAYRRGKILGDIISPIDIEWEAIK